MSPPSLSPIRLRVILAVLVITEINSAFEVGMMYGILGTLVREFRDPVGVGWLITGFLLVGAASAALCSRLGDLYGRRRLVLVMLCFAASGSLVSALTDSLGGLIAGRALQGVAAALLPLCIGLARELFPAGAGSRGDRLAGRRRELRRERRHSLRRLAGRQRRLALDLLDRRRSRGAVDRLRGAAAAPLAATREHRPARHAGRRAVRAGGGRHPAGRHAGQDRGPR